MIVKEASSRKALSYFSLAVLVIFNGLLAGFLTYIGKNFVESTKKSQVLNVSKDVQKEMSGQSR